MGWVSGYFAMAVLVAAIALVAAGWFRDVHVAAPDRPGVTAAVAGLLWPIVLVGIVELLAVIGLRSSLRSRVQLVSPRHRPESRILSASASTTRGSWGSGR